MRRWKKAVVVALLAVTGLICVGSCGKDDGERVHVDTHMRLRFFDLKDMFPDPVFFPDEDLRERPAWPTVRGVDLELALITHIRQATGGKEVWGNTTEDWRDDNLKALPVFEVRNRILIVRSTSAVLGHIEELLAEIRASGDPVAYLEDCR